MTDYDGVLGVGLISRARHGIESCAGYPRYSDFDISDTEARGGTYSLKLLGGAKYEVGYGCLAEETTIIVYVKFDTGASCALELIYKGELIARTVPVGDGSIWEKLEIVETTEKKIYTVRMVNYGNNAAAYFDDLQ